jgi:hypothetical protein
MTWPDRAGAKVDPMDGPEHDDPVLLTWSVHLIRQHPWKGVGAAVGIVGTTALLWLTLGAAGALFLGLALALSVAPFFVPQEYRLSKRQVRVRRGLRWHAHRWEAFRRAGRRKGRVLLSAFPAEHPLDAWRGLVLVPAGNDAEVWGFVQDRLADQGQADERAGLQEH